MTVLFSHPLFGVTLTLCVFILSKSLYEKYRLTLLNPVFISVICIISLLKVFDISFDNYNSGGVFISFFLGPAVVALGVPLYREGERIAKNLIPLLTAIFIGSCSGIISVVLLAFLLHADPHIIATLAPKSVTTPIAMGIAAKIDGYENFTAAIVIATGIIGAIIGPPLLLILGIKSKRALGLAMGAAGHGIGTARAFEAGQTEGAYGGLAICLNGIMTAFLAPYLLKLFYFIVSLQ